jgi:hypothetical protein
MTTKARGEDHVTIPMHNPIRVGTLGEILDDVATHSGILREQLLKELDL